MRLYVSLLSLLLGTAAAGLLVGCATPVAPSGGPADTVPPTLLGSLPASGTTRVTDRVLALQFSERLDAASAPRAVRVTPEADGAVPPRVTVRGNSLVIELPALREATTYVVTVGTDLADARRVRLAAPVTVAFSTGDTIDAGQIEGTVREPVAGAPVGGLAVWAYATSTRPGDPTVADSATDVRQRAPDYRTETGTDGRFRLAYLRPGPYRLLAVADANRNGRADAGEAFALPPRAAVEADTVLRGAVDLFVTTADTTAPSVRAVRAVSDRRLAIRFSEAVVLRAEAGGWTALDSVSGETLPLRPYQPVASEVHLLASRSLPATTRLRLTLAGAVADSAGNALVPFERTVPTAEARPDTAVARLVAFVPRAPRDSVQALAPGEWPGARFTLPPDTAAVGLQTADGRTLDARRVSTDGLTLRLVPLSPLPDGAELTVAVAAPDTVRTARYRLGGADDTGGIVGTVPDAPAGARVVVEATRVGGRETQSVAAGPDGRFAFSHLPPGRYRLRLWTDRDGDGRWSGGRVAPFERPEPLLLVAEPVAVRARWDTEVEPERLAFPSR